MVDVDRLSAVSEQLSKTIPADILEAKEILKQKESILNHTQLEARRIREEAAEEADQIMSAAREEHVSKVDETEVLRVASEKADEMNQGAMVEAPANRPGRTAQGIPPHRRGRARRGRAP